MTGYAGLKEGKQLVCEEHERLRTRLTEAFLKQLMRLPEQVEGVPEDPEMLPHVQKSKPRKLADGSVIPAMTLAVPVEEGGVYEALWKLGEMARVGLNADQNRIPVKQEIIEVCEILDRNIYQMASGCWLYLADNGNGCPGYVIGQTNTSKGRTITGAEGVRYLDKPRH